MKRKVVFLEENTVNDEGLVIFSADIPYEVDNRGNIENEDSLKVPMNNIWVDFRVIHQTVR